MAVCRESPAGDFERGLAKRESLAVIAPHVESEVRRSRDYLGVVIVATVAAADVATLRNMPLVSHQGGSMLALNTGSPVLLPELSHQLGQVGGCSIRAIGQESLGQ